MGKIDNHFSILHHPRIFQSHSIQYFQKTIFNVQRSNINTKKYQYFPTPKEPHK